MAYHQKEQTVKKLKEKAAFRNPDEFNFKMVKTKTINGVPRPQRKANKYTPEELMLMKTQDMAYILQKLQSEKKKIERLTAALHSLDEQPSKGHVYYAMDREEAKELQLKTSENTLLRHGDLPEDVKSKTAASYRELEARKSRANDLEKLYMDMAMQKELQKKGRKRKLREDELCCPTNKPVYKWRQERKR